MKNVNFVCTLELIIYLLYLKSKSVIFYEDVNVNDDCSLVLCSLDTKRTKASIINNSRVI